MAHHAQSVSRVLSLLFVAAIVCVGVARAEAPVAARIGYVDMKRLLDNAPQVVSGRKQLER